MRISKREAQQIIAYSNVTPVWLLPYLRLLKGAAGYDYCIAYELLPHYLPKGVSCPTRAMVAVVLTYHQIA